MKTRNILIELHPAMEFSDSPLVDMVQKVGMRTAKPMCRIPHTVHWCGCEEGSDCYCEGGIVVRVAHDACTEEQKAVLKESADYYNEDYWDERTRRAESGWCE